MEFKLRLNSDAFDKSIQQTIEKLQGDVYSFLWDALKFEKSVEIRSYINGPTEYKTDTFTITVHPPELIQDLDRYILRVRIVRRSNL